MEARYSPHFLLAEGGPSDIEGVSLFVCCIGKIKCSIIKDILTLLSLWKQTVIIPVFENGNATLILLICTDVTSNYIHVIVCSHLIGKKQSTSCHPTMLAGINNNMNGEMNHFVF